MFVFRSKLIDIIIVTDAHICTRVSRPFPWDGQLLGLGLLYSIVDEFSCSAGEGKGRSGLVLKISYM